jgi:signal transduction histidine kinase/CheY-like chemotaxis protein
MTATVSGAILPARVLVVEDENIVAMDLRASLERLGYEVTDTAGSAADALDSAEANRPDLVLMDIRIRGDMDGTEAAEQMRRRFNLPVVYLTAYSDDATLQRAQVTEPFGYLLKPFDERELQIVVQMALFRHRSQQEHEALLREQAARGALEEEQRWIKFFADASTAIGESLDIERTLQKVTGLAVPTLADWAILTVKRETGTETVAISHAGGNEALLWEVLKRYPPDPALPRGFPHVIRTGQAELIPEFTPEVLGAFAVDAENLRMLRAIAPQSQLSVPLVIRGETYGALTLVSAESGRRFAPEDVARATELARRCANAIENARLYQLAQSAIAMRDEFLSVAAHELRTPLASVLLQLYGLQRTTEGRDDAVQKKAVDLIGQFNRLSALVDRLLDVSRISAGRLDMQVERTDLAQIVRETARRFIEPAARVGATLTVTAPEELVGTWDPLRIEQVLTNLLGNAVKFCTGKPIALGLEARGEGVQLTLRDAGVGIAKERLPYIFERFERGVSARNYGGLGLGLYVSRQIVEAHGGHIEVESELGQGTSFRIFLPRHAPAKA